MAYIKKYSFPFITKFEKNAVLELWEDTIDTTVYEFQGINFQIQYIPNSDNVFEVFYATQLSAVIDVTDNITGNTSEFIPNLTTLNDRKYQAKLIIDSEIIYSGWTLSDSVSLSFTTGRKELSFNCVDGLAMLKDIQFSKGIPTNNNNTYTLLSFILECLNAIQFSNNLNVISNVSYYADGMLDRTDGLQYEPFKQTYVYGNSFIDNDGNYENLYDILEKILKSFGAKIIQSNNKWNIISINQLAQETRYFTEYNSSGTVVDYGTISTEFLLQPYLGNTSNLYFIDNSQLKLLKKGYNNIICDSKIEYCGNYLFNSQLKYLDSLSLPIGYVNITTGSGFVTLIQNNSLQYNYIKLDTITGPAKAEFRTNYNLFIAEKGKVKVSFEMQNWDLTGTIAAKIILVVSNISGSWYYNNNKQWFIKTTEPTDYYEILNSEISKDVPYEFSMTTSGVPYGGSIQFGIQTNNSYSKTLTAGNFKIEQASLFKEVLIESKLSNEQAYTLSIDCPLGIPVNMDGYNNYKGFLSNNAGLQLVNWYRQESPTQIFRGLAQLIVRQYMNIYQKNIINIDCNISSIDTNNGLINSWSPIKISTDTDPSSINVENSYYMLGNTNIDLYSDTIQSTLLQINNTNVTDAEIITTYNNGDAPILPSVCNCYRIECLNPYVEYSYIDCDGNSFWNLKPYTGPFYVAASTKPEVPGGSSTLVSSSFCSI